MDTVTKLKLADHLFEPLLAGEKTITIREGARLVVPGPLTFESASGLLAPVEVEVYMTVFKRAIDLTDEEAQMDGYQTSLGLFDGLRQFYPDLTPLSVVTIIAFEPPESQGAGEAALAA